MIQLLWRSDVHLSDAPPASRVDDWAETVFQKLAQVGAVAAKLKVDAVLDGGDFFHIKSPGRNSHELVRRVIDLHRTYPCPVYANVGNHDCVYGDYSFLGQQPLGVLFSTGTFQRLYDDHEAVFEKDGVKVRVVGVPYHGTTYDMDRFWRITKGDEDHLVVVAHVLASKNGGSMFEGEDIIKYGDLANHPASVLAFGHWHKNQGVETINGKHFVNVGSLTRGSLSEDEITRAPVIAYFKFTKQNIEIKTIRLKVKPSEEVFDLQKRVQVEQRTASIDNFVASIKETLLDSETQDLGEVIKGMSLPDKVRESALLYLEQAN